MKRTSDAPPEASVANAGTSDGLRVRQPWVRPRLVRVGSVAQVTARVDNKGRNDGGSGSMRRT